MRVPVNCSSDDAVGLKSLVQSHVMHTKTTQTRSLCSDSFACVVPHVLLLLQHAPHPLLLWHLHARVQHVCGRRLRPHRPILPQRIRGLTRVDVEGSALDHTHHTSEPWPRHHSRLHHIVESREPMHSHQPLLQPVRRLLQHTCGQAPADERCKTHHCTHCTGGAGSPGHHTLHSDHQRQRARLPCHQQEMAHHGHCLVLLRT